ncbi:MAG: two-component system response regulator [Desulfamplus sp.]|nr:two-component system response regulator [Desulfamplus sp.]MBF0242411.1 two-component system response regulator [Desulfamplus sp.]MBF0390638.1 two-component system response regulator [Desulfamplus sp.]
MDSFNFTVMVVDDTEANIDVLVNTLEDMYDVRVAMDGETALDDIMEEPPDLILLDIMMPGMDGYEVCRRLKADEATKNIPVIFLTAMTDEKDEAKGLSLGAVDYVTKPFSPDLVKARVKNQLDLKKYRDNLEAMVQERTKELMLTQEVTIYSLACLAETRDPETGGHILRTQQYVKILAEELKNHPKYSDFLDDHTIDLLFKSAPLHDIGKVGVPDSILMKTGKLTDEEFAEMKNHTIRGRDALKFAEIKLGSNSFMRYAREISYTHQEKWDGSGYPEGIKGEEIPISGRLMAIADVYDALVSKRFYKPAFSHKKAIEIIKEGKGTHFDPDMVDAFVAVGDKVLEVAMQLADSEEERAALQS